MAEVLTDGGVSLPAPRGPAAVPGSTTTNVPEPDDTETVVSYRVPNHRRADTAATALESAEHPAGPPQRLRTEEVETRVASSPLAKQHVDAAFGDTVLAMPSIDDLHEDRAAAASARRRRRAWMQVVVVLTSSFVVGIAAAVALATC
jgi:hypothetical protein